MTKRATIVLAVVNAALLAFIFFVERGTLSTGELERRRGQVLSRFIRDRVERVELDRGDAAPIVLVREREEEGDLGTWRVAEPIATEADEDAVDSFLSALEWLDSRRTLEEISADDRGRFGLDDPRFVVRFVVGEEPVELRIGSEAPTGEGVYAAVEGEQRAYVVGQDFVESIDHDLSHFRSKELFDGFFAANAASLRLVAEDLEVRMQKRDGRWHVTRPVTGWANQGLLDALLRVVSEASARRFVAEEATDLAEYGLESPWRELVVERAQDAGGQPRARLRVGNRCGEHAQERYALAGDEGPIVCVPESELSALEVDASSLREPRLSTLTPDAVEKIVIEAGGPRLELRRSEVRWELRTGPEGSGEARDASDAAIADWLRALRDARAQAFEPIEGDAPGHGLAEPSATVSLHLSDGGGSDGSSVVRLRLGDVGAEGAWVRRGQEEAVVRFADDVASLLRADALRFRDTDLVDAEASAARSVRLRRGDVEERAARTEGGAWRLQSPIEAEADRVVVREIVRQLAELHALRFVAERPSAEHALASPRRLVEVRFEPDEGEEGQAQTVTLKIGAPTVDGAYAQLGEDGPVFELPQAALDALDRPLVSLDTLSVDTQQLRSIRVEAGNRSVELTRQGTRWAAAGGEADPERTRALLDRLRTLRASGVARYGEPDGSLGLREPPVRLTLTRAEGSEPPRVVLELGAPRGQGDEAFVPARRADVPVIYRLAPDGVRALRYGLE